MINTVSLKGIKKLTVAKAAGGLALAGLAVAFFSFPIASLAKCGQQPVQKATFVSLVKGVAVYEGANAAPEFKAMQGYVNSGSWIEVTVNGKPVTAEITSTPKNGVANGFEAHEGTNITKAVKLQVSGVPSGLFTPPSTTAKP